VLLISPILCFTGEEAWDIIGGGEEDSVLFHTWHEFPSINEKSEEALLKKWQAVREVREAVTAAIEPLRADKSVGSSLQAEVAITAPDTLAGYLKALGEELRFALLVSEVSVAKGDELAVAAKVSGGEKCERCWHYTDDVGSVAAHPTLCARCAENVRWQRRNETLRLNAEVVKKAV
jgi:isoleucyl-tRNA synthetase